MHVCCATGRRAGFNRSIVFRRQRRAASPKYGGWAAESTAESIVLHGLTKCVQ